MDDSRFDLAPGADERTVLTCFLEFQRDALIRKCDGLSDEQLCRRPLPSSGLSLAGLVRHLATVERWYFQSIVAGRSPGSIYDHDSDEEFAGVASSSRSEAFGTWTAEVGISRQILEERSLDVVGTNTASGRQHSLRWVLAHMIDEYARHLGHADLLREVIDGSVGE